MTDAELFHFHVFSRWGECERCHMINWTCDYCHMCIKCVVDMSLPAMYNSHAGKGNGHKRRVVFYAPD